MTITNIEQLKANKVERDHFHRRYKTICDEIYDINCEIDYEIITSCDKEKINRMNSRIEELTVEMVECLKNVNIYTDRMAELVK